jgi:basic membrane protein A
MFGRSTVLHTLVLAACIVPFAGCSKNTAPPPPPRIAFLGDTSGFPPGSFDEQAATGLSACAAATGAAITRATPASDADVEAQLNLLATENFDTVIAMGASVAPDMGTVARKFESTHFAIVDAVVPVPNVESITFKDQDGSFLAGALAALFSKTKHVAFLGGADIPRLQAAAAGFEAGVREIDPHVRVDTAFAGSFTDEAAGMSHGKALYAGGADVVYVVAGRAGLGAIAAAKGARNDYVIGVDSNQDGLAPGKVLTSVLRRVDHAVARVCFETAAQKPPSGHIEMGLADGGVGLTDFRYSKTVVGVQALARIGRIASAIVAGTIVPPATSAQLAAFRPIPVR